MGAGPALSLQSIIAIRPGAGPAACSTSPVGHVLVALAAFSSSSMTANGTSSVWSASTTSSPSGGQP
jgi:hypothetical protein